MQNQIKPNRPQGYSFVPKQPNRAQRLYRTARGEIIDIEVLKVQQAELSNTLALVFDYEANE